MFLVIFLWAVLASTFVFAKNIVAYSTPAFIVGVRFILAGSVLLAYQWFRDKKSLAIKKEHLITFLFVSLFHVYIAFMLEFWCLKYVSALKTTIIYSSTPFVIAILAFFIVKERLFKLLQPGADLEPKIGNFVFDYVYVESFLDGKPEARDAVIEDFGKDRQCGFLMQKTVKRVFDDL